ncbi:MAG TPA: sugar phosphate isomerase/epimerase family protein [Clostridia bacterium]|nr:sugar phosphate isomerase/epimerase family protein [Clostridia bacterium]
MTSLFREQRECAEHTGYSESIRRCRQAGFTVLDFNLCALPRRQTTLHRDDWKSQVDAIRNEAEKLGVVFVQSHPPYRAARGNAFATPEEEAFFNDMALRAIEISAMLGIRWAVLHPATAPGEESCDLQAHLRFNHEVFDREIELAHKLGVGCAFENMCDGPQRRRFGVTAQELELLMDSYASPLVGICWDVGHAHRMNDDQTPAILRLGGRIKALHIDDNVGQTDLHALPFMGTVNWEGVMHALHASGCEADLIFEIVTNRHMPDALRDWTASYCYRVGEYLLSLYR